MKILQNNRTLPFLLGLLLFSGLARADLTPLTTVNENIQRWKLDDVLRIAFQNNPDLKSAEANYQATSKTIMQAVSGYLPQVNVIAGLNETNLPSPSAGASAQVGIKLTYSSAVVNLSQTLFDFGKNLSLINSSRSQASSAQQEAEAVKNVVQVVVERAFYDVIAAQKLLEAAKHSLDQFQETYRTTSVLVRTGSRPAFDLSQANVELAKSKLSYINAENSLDLSKIALLNFMGFAQQIDFQLQEPEKTDQTRSGELDLSHLEQRALDFRPEMKSSEYAVKDARYQMHAEMTQYLPTLSFQGYYGTYQPNYPVEIRTAYSAGLALTWNIFDGLRTTSRVGELGYRLDQREALQEKEREAIVAEVARDYKELIRSESQLTVATDALASAKENSDLAHKRYQASVATILELLVAETSLIEAEGAAIQARYQREIALTQLKVAVNAPLKD